MLHKIQQLVAWALAILAFISYPLYEFKHVDDTLVVHSFIGLYFGLKSCLGIALVFLVAYLLARLVYTLIMNIGKKKHKQK